MVFLLFCPMHMPRVTDFTNHLLIVGTTMRGEETHMKTKKVSCSTNVLELFSCFLHTHVLSVLVILEQMQVS